MKKLYDWFASWGIVRKLTQKPLFAKLLSYEVLIYLFFGGVTTLLNIVVLFVFKKLLGDRVYFTVGTFRFTSLLLANFIAWVAAVVFAYVANKLWVFESRSWKANVVVREALSFAGARIFSFAVEEIGLYVFCEVIGINTLLTKVVLGVIVIVLNYVFSKLIIFRGEDEKGVSSKGKQVLVMSAFVLVLLIISALFARSYEKKHPRDQVVENVSVTDQAA